VTVEVHDQTITDEGARSYAAALAELPDARLAPRLIPRRGSAASLNRN
jgi:hypothetical protein